MHSQFTTVGLLRCLLLLHIYLAPGHSRDLSLLRHCTPLHRLLLPLCHAPHHCTHFLYSSYVTISRMLRFMGLVCTCDAPFCTIPLRGHCITHISPPLQHSFFTTPWDHCSCLRLDWDLFTRFWFTFHWDPCPAHTAGLVHAPAGRWDRMHLHFAGSFSGCHRFRRRSHFPACTFVRRTPVPPRFFAFLPSLRSRSRHGSAHRVRFRTLHCAGITAPIPAHARLLPARCCLAAGLRHTVSAHACISPLRSPLSAPTRMDRSLHCAHVCALATAAAAFLHAHSVLVCIFWFATHALLPAVSPCTLYAATFSWTRRAPFSDTVFVPQGLRNTAAGHSAIFWTFSYTASSGYCLCDATFHHGSSAFTREIRTHLLRCTVLFAHTWFFSHFRLPYTRTTYAALLYLFILHLVCCHAIVAAFSHARICRPRFLHSVCGSSYSACTLHATFSPFVAFSRLYNACAAARVTPHACWVLHFLGFCALCWFFSAHGSGFTHSYTHAVYRAYCATSVYGRTTPT